MSVQSVLLPVFVLVALTFALLLWTGYLRNKAIRAGETKIRDMALGQDVWPPRPTQVANCFANQFELPVLFYVLVVLALALRKADLVFVILSWVFVASRLVHAYIHTDWNYVPYRFAAYLVGAVVLMIMWVIFALQILLAIL